MRFRVNGMCALWRNEIPSLFFISVKSKWEGGEGGKTKMQLDSYLMKGHSIKQKKRWEKRMCEKESIYKKTSQKIGQRIFDISRFFSNPINSLLLLFNSRYGDQSKWIKHGQKKGIDPKIGVRFFRVLNNTDTPIGFLFNL